MLRKLSFCATVIAAASPAGAQPVDDLGARGQIIIGADRLSPLFSYSRIKQDQGGGDSETTSTTSMNFLWAGDPQDVYDIPRLGLDYVVAPNVTVGGDLFATLPVSASRSTTQGGMTTSRDTQKINAFGIGARAGYILPAAHNVFFWGRGGLSYTRVGTTNPPNMGGNQQSSSVSQTGLSLEPLFVIGVTPHFGILLGPVLDIPLTGTAHNEFTMGGMTVSQDNDESQLHVGITAGLVGWF
jgi:hypothetical protein